jgi:hypothetical protein
LGWSLVLITNYFCFVYAVSELLTKQLDFVMCLSFMLNTFMIVSTVQTFIEFTLLHNPDVHAMFMMKNVNSGDLLRTCVDAQFVRHYENTEIVIQKNTIVIALLINVRDPRASIDSPKVWNLVNTPMGIGFVHALVCEPVTVHSKQHTL